MEIHSPAGPLPDIPDNLTVSQFIFEYQPSIRPVRTPDIPWLIEDETGRKIFAEEAKKRTAGLANGLSLKYGIREDDVVLLYSRNHVVEGGFGHDQVSKCSIDYPIAIWAVHQLGGVISGANPDFTSNELLYQLKETKATLLIVHPDALQTAISAARDAGVSLDRIVLFNPAKSDTNGGIKLTKGHTTVNDLVDLGNQASSPSFVERRLGPGEAKTKLAFLSFSSGTTGRPKAVAIAHFSLIANVIQMAAHNKVNENYCDWKDQRFRLGDVAIGVLPLYHIYGLVLNLHFILFSGMSLVVVPKFNFVDMLNSIVRHRISHLMLVPPIIVLLCKHPAVKNYDIRRYIRCIMSGAAPLSFEVTQQLYDMLPDAHIGQAYGMTETCTATTMWPISQKRGTPGSGGQLVPGTVARVVKPDGSLCGYDEAGELVIKTPSVALGYANNEQASKETFIDGWVKSGDEVKIDRNGEVWVLDRIKEIMKVRGFQVAPAELEGCILDHPDVSNACVVGVPDDFSGEVPLAFVVLTNDAAKRIETNPRISDEIKASIAKHVADNKVAYKRLTGGVEFVSSIPTSPSGKLLRRVLRDQAKEKKIKAKL